MATLADNVAVIGMLGGFSPATVADIMDLLAMSVPKTTSSTLGRTSSALKSIAGIAGKAATALTIRLIRIIPAGENASAPKVSVIVATALTTVAILRSTESFTDSVGGLILAIALSFALIIDAAAGSPRGILSAAASLTKVGSVASSVMLGKCAGSGRIIFGGTGICIIAIAEAAKSGESGSSPATFNCAINLATTESFITSVMSAFIDACNIGATEVFRLFAMTCACAASFIGSAMANGPIGH